jgi:hypothetical protein
MGNNFTCTNSRSRISKNISVVLQSDNTNSVTLRIRNMGCQQQDFAITNIFPSRSCPPTNGQISTSNTGDGWMDLPKHKTHLAFGGNIHHERILTPTTRLSRIIWATTTTTIWMPTVIPTSCNTAHLLVEPTFILRCLTKTSGRH